MLWTYEWIYVIFVVNVWQKAFAKDSLLLKAIGDNLRNVQYGNKFWLPRVMYVPWQGHASTFLMHSQKLNMDFAKEFGNFWFFFGEDLAKSRGKELRVTGECLKS